MVMDHLFILAGPTLIITVIVWRLDLKESKKRLTEYVVKI